ncbi:unnamed protein product [Boreogadus saida]
MEITECPVFDALRRPSSVATSSAASTSGSDPHPSTALSESLTAAVPPLSVPIFMRSSFIYAQRTCWAILEIVPQTTSSQGSVAGGAAQRSNASRGGSVTPFSPPPPEYSYISLEA